MIFTCICIYSYLPQMPSLFIYTCSWVQSTAPLEFSWPRIWSSLQSEQFSAKHQGQSFCVAWSQMFTVYSFMSCWDFCCCHYFPCWFIVFLLLLQLAYMQWLKRPMCHLTVLCGWKPVSHPLGSVGSLFNSDTKLAAELGLILHSVRINVLPILIQLLTKVKWMWLQNWLISRWP